MPSPFQLLGAFYILSKKQVEYGMLFLKVGVVAGILSSVWMLFPSGDRQGKMIAEYQPVTLAAMEGLFQSTKALRSC